MAASTTSLHTNKKAAHYERLPHASTIVLIAMFFNSVLIVDPLSNVCIAKV